MIIIFRTRIRELRESAGYRSQQSFADAFGIAQSTVGGWEAGKREPNYDTTIRLSNFFHVSIDYLLGRTSSKDCIPASPDWDGSRLVELRKAAGEAPEHVAEVIGISESLYSKFENTQAEPSISILMRLADHFSTDVDCILGRHFDNPDTHGNISTGNFQISKSEQHFVECYRSATQKERDIINSILSEYRKKAISGETAG